MINDLKQRIANKTSSFIEWLVIDLFIGILPLVIKLIFLNVRTVDIYVELFFMVILLSTGTLKTLHNLKKTENILDSLFWVSLFNLIFSSILYGSLITSGSSDGKILVTIILVVLDISAVLVSLTVWYKSED